MKNTIVHYFNYWWVLSRNSFSMVLSQKLAIWFFLTGKIIRFMFFAGFLYFLLTGAGSLAGYNKYQVLFFFLSFNLVDISSQFLFREVYRFRTKVITGDFDLVLTKPVNPLFTALLGGADVMDLITLPPLIIAILWVGSLLDPSILNTVLFLLLIINGILIATAFHIAVMAMGIITLEIDHSIMIYRDLTSLGRFPVDIYKEPLRAVLTYLLPVGIMMSFPSKALMGMLSPAGIFTAFTLSALAIYLSLKFWNFALKRYTSASS